MIRRIVSIVALTVIVTALAALGLNGNVFAGFQRRATDALLPSAPSDPHVVVVGFDRKTIATPGLGNPLPREKVAELVDQLKADGARVIVFDVTYSQESQEQVAPDALLAKAITNAGNVVLAVKGTSGKQDHGVVRLDNESGFAAGLRDADFTVGHAQTNQDPTDGVNRSLPLVVEAADGTFVPALSLAAVMRYRGITEPPIVRPDGVQIGNRFVPAIGAKSLLLNFAERLSAHAVKIVHAVEDDRQAAAERLVP